MSLLDKPTEKQEPTYQIYPRATPTPEPPQQDFFRFRIQSEDILLEIEHKLRGEMYDVKTGRWDPKYGKWCNDLGINIILSLVYDYANKNIYLANLTKDEIFFKCKHMKKKLAKLIFNKYHDYGIDKVKRDLIVKKVVDAVHSCLSRCEDGREAEQISTATQRHEIFQGKEETVKPISPFKKLFRGVK